MKILILYDSKYGNTAELAQSMEKALEMKHDTDCKSISDVTSLEFDKADLLIVGSPTHGGRPTQDLLNLIDSMPSDALEDKQFAAFDTSIDTKDMGIFLKILISIIGYAAPKLHSQLKKRGGKSVGSATTFFVAGKEGPLKAGEKQRAQDWVKSLL